MRLDFDDFSGHHGGHHSVRWSRRCGARREAAAPARIFVAAYVIGVEVEIRLARAVIFILTTRAGIRPRRSASSAPRRPPAI